MSFDPDHALAQAKAIPPIHELQGAELAPSPELESLVSTAAAALGLEARCVREVDDERLRWYAEVKTTRGTVRREVDDERSWEDAFRELGLLP